MAGGRVAHLQVGKLLLLVGDGLLHQHALDALLHGILLGLREKAVRSTGGPAFGEMGLPPPPKGSPATEPQEGHAHLLEGLLLLRRQGRQSQLRGCALPVLHLDGVCPLQTGAGRWLRASPQRPSRGPRPTPPSAQPLRVACSSAHLQESLVRHTPKQTGTLGLGPLAHPEQLQDPGPSGVTKTSKEQSEEPSLHGKPKPRASGSSCTGELAGTGLPDKGRARALWMFWDDPLLGCLAPRSLTTSHGQRLGFPARDQFQGPLKRASLGGATLPAQLQAVPHPHPCTPSGDLNLLSQPTSPNFSLGYA